MALLLVFTSAPAIINAQTRTKARAAHYECPMHPEVGSTKPGKCRKCGMTLVKKQPAPAASTDAPKTVADTKPAGDTKPAVSSMKIPDAEVLDQNGKELKFYSDLVKDKIVAINFIFTTCTTICPPLTATFRRVQQEAASRQLDVQLISISVDPTTDTPERLRDFAAKFKAGPNWTFITGDKAHIDSVLQALGVAVSNKNDHTPMVLIGNEASDFWTLAYGLASPAKLVDLLANAANRK
ncbi:MAG TPA: SCO family protein [Pyrinomonadaceae bacterium]|nr:SCO family protein [Pyrinomonadaceae bacterium]